VRDPFPPEAILADVPPPIAAVAGALRAILREAAPDAVEAVRAGWGIIGYDAVEGRRHAHFAWIWPERVHVHLGFVHGVSMRDPDGLLRGDAKLARWLPFEPGDRPDPAQLAALIAEGRRVSLLPRILRAEAQVVEAR
jgi:hypothetical protein